MWTKNIEITMKVYMSEINTTTCSVYNLVMDLCLN